LKLKGLEKFREKTLIFNGVRIWLLPLYGFTVLFFFVLVMTGVYSLPDMLRGDGKYDYLLVLIPLIGEIVVCALALTLVYQMWYWRKHLKKKYGALSYAHIFPIGFLGISSMLSVPIDIFLHYWSYSPDFWANSAFGFLATGPPRI
jgi:hypothetical protein